MSAIHLNTQEIRLTRGPAGVVSCRSPLSSLVCRNAAAVKPDATLAEAATAMASSGVSAMLIEDGGGLLTEHDVVRAVAQGVAPDAPVTEAATPQPMAVPGSTTIVDACAAMLNEGVRHLVVDVDGTLGVLPLAEIAAVHLQTADPQVWLASLRVAIDVPTEVWLG